MALWRKLTIVCRSCIPAKKTGLRTSDVAVEGVGVGTLIRSDRVICRVDSQDVTSRSGKYAYAQRTTLIGNTAQIR